MNYDIIIITVNIILLYHNYHSIFIPLTISIITSIIHNQLHYRAYHLYLLSKLWQRPSWLKLSLAMHWNNHLFSTLLLCNKTSTYLLFFLLLNLTAPCCYFLLLLLGTATPRFCFLFLLLLLALNCSLFWSASCRCPLTLLLVIAACCYCFILLLVPSR